jgi:hypothetical protein
VLFVGHSELGTDRQPLIVLILQHAQEKKEASAAASAMLRFGEHADVGNSYSCGWACSVAAGEFLGRKGQGDRPDLAISASGIPGYFPDRGLIRVISADSPAKFPASLTEVPGWVDIGN